MKRIIVKKEHLVEFIDNKKAERVFYQIIEDMHKNVKFLNESVSHKKANQSIIDNYKRKNLITPKVYKMLVKHKIINENYEIM